MRIALAIRDLLRDIGKAGGKGDEGAWAPDIDDETGFEIVTSAAQAVTDEMDVKVDVGIDVAASQLWHANDEFYHYRDKKRNTEEQIAYIGELVDRYEVIYVEDPLHEEDFQGFADLTEQVGDKCLVCGDDLFVTSVARIIQGIETGSANCVLIKPNQVGTLSDTYEAIQIAHTYGLDTVMSHRSGETPDTTIAHLAMAFKCIFLKTGAVGGERIAKLNELIRIEEQLE